MLSSGSISTLVGVLSGTDEAIRPSHGRHRGLGICSRGRGHADELAELKPSGLSRARADTAHAEVARTRDVLNKALAGIGLDAFVAEELVGSSLSMIPLDFDVMTSGTERRSYRHLVPVADVIPTVKGRDVRPNRDEDGVSPTRTHVNASQDILSFGRERLGQFQETRVSLGRGS